jgi:ComF family protein
VLDWLLEIIAPTGCAACDEPVGPRALFCRACAVSADEALGAPLAAFAYGGALATAIGRFKYEGRSDLAPRLAASLARAAAPLLGRVDLVVPVPLHGRRLAERGYNQAALLAGPVARRLGVAHAPRALVRRWDTPRLATLDRTARASSVRDAFTCAAAVRGLRVLVVDDVRTTGATLGACAEALSRAGAGSVISLTLARKD